MTNDEILMTQEFRRPNPVPTERPVRFLRFGFVADFAARIWNLIQQPRTFAELRDILIAEFEVDAVQLEADIRDLLNQLADNQLVEISG